MSLRATRNDDSGAGRKRVSVNSSLLNSKCGSCLLMKSCLKKESTNAYCESLKNKENFVFNHELVSQLDDQV